MLDAYMLLLLLLPGLLACLCTSAMATQHRCLGLQDCMFVAAAGFPLLLLPPELPPAFAPVTVYIMCQLLLLLSPSACYCFLSIGSSTNLQTALLFGAAGLNHRFDAAHF